MKKISDIPPLSPKSDKLSPEEIGNKIKELEETKELGYDEIEFARKFLKDYPEAKDVKDPKDWQRIYGQVTRVLANQKPEIVRKEVKRTLDNILEGKPLFEKKEVEEKGPFVKLEPEIEAIEKRVAEEEKRKKI